MRTITAIIPVREGSRRLKNKNIAPFAGTNLLINKINQLKQVQEIANIVVSSDSDLMLAMAKFQGVMVHKRAPEFCDEKTKTFGEVMAHICQNVPGDGILLAPCEKMIEWNYFHGTHPYRFIFDKRPSVDIDDGLDLACARAWLDMDETVSQIDPRYINSHEFPGGYYKLTQYMPLRKEAA